MANSDDHAAALNNAGFAAILRGDYVQAENLLQLAMKAKGTFYARAAANLQLAQGLQSQHGNASGAPSLAGH
jgi:Flp pilus assembly protein TadD